MSLKTHTPPGTSKKTLGLIAGEGDLPKAVASEAKKMGYRVVAIALQLGSECRYDSCSDSCRSPATNQSLNAFVDDFHKVHIGRFGKIIKLLKNLSVTESVIVGKVSKSLLYQNKKSIRPDLKALKLLFSLKNRSDETLMLAISTELEKSGIKLLKATTFTKNLLTPERVLTKKHPKRSQWNDIEYGWKIAKEVGRLDIGQTIVVKGTAVMAVEAIEGTDEAILRGGRLAGQGAVVIKVSRPQQDMRLDVPVVGIDTLFAMKKADAKALAVEAGKSIIVDRERFIKEADKAEIVVVGISLK